MICTIVDCSKNRSFLFVYFDYVAFGYQRSHVVCMAYLEMKYIAETFRT